MHNKHALRIGIIGCGAAAELVHLPALKMFNVIQVNAFADNNIARAKELSAHFPGAIATADYKDLIRHTDAVIITSPNYLHAPQSIFCLQHGVHVFSEKPMATSLRDAKHMVNEAKKYRRALSIGMVRRYFDVYRGIKQLLDTHTYGRVLSYLCEEGYPFKWPLQSTYAFEKSKAGGGVLMDLGSHVLDLLTYLFGDTTIHAYFDDSYGGVEANSHIDLAHKGFHGFVKLSRERMLKNTLTITCESGIISSAIPQYSDITVTSNGRTHVQHINHNGTRAVYRELKDFFDSAISGTSPLTAGSSVITSMDLIERCYRIKKSIPAPWLRPVL